MKYWEIGSFFSRIKYIEAETLDEVCKKYMSDYYTNLFINYKGCNRSDKNNFTVTIDYEYTAYGLDKPVKDKLICICKELTPEEYIEKKLLK